VNQAVLAENGAYGRPIDIAGIRRAHLRTALTHILWHDR